MEIEIMVYGFVEVSSDKDGVYHQTYYFATEQAMNETLILSIADNPYNEYYPFEKTKTIKV